MLSRNGLRNEDGNFDWVDAVIDASIMAGLSFFTTLGALGAVGLMNEPDVGIVAAVLAAGTQFFMVLGIKRKLVKE